MAKTQYSLTDDQTKLGAPTGFEVTVRNLKISAGAGFIVALTGDIMTMPGLPKVPAAERIDVDATGKITGNKTQKKETFLRECLFFYVFIAKYYKR